MIRKWFGVLIAATAMTVALAGCGEEKNVDPYLQVSLRQALYGPPPASKGYKYKIVNPQIVEAVGHLCLVREGNVTGLIAGRSIADKISDLDKSNITFNVVKKYSPLVHFVAEQVVSGTDTVFISQAGSILYPRITPAAEFHSKDHEPTKMVNFRWNRSDALKKMVDGKFEVKAQLARVEEDGEEVWMLVGPRGSLRVERPNDAIEMALRLLAAEGKDFEGGITFDEVEDYADRKNSHVCGTVTIDYVKYLDRVFS